MSSAMKDARWVIALAAADEAGWICSELTFRECEAVLADAQRQVAQLPDVIVELIAKGIV